MTRQTASDFDPEVLKLFDEFVHGLISRRDFLDAAQRFDVGGLGAVGILAALSPRFAEAQEIAGNDHRIQPGRFEILSPKGYGTVSGYRVTPTHAKKDPLPVVLVVHENRGLNPHIEDIARRLAVAGFIAFAPDALAPVGGYPGDEDKARELFKTLDPARTHEDFIAAASSLESLPEGNGRVGVVGFCWGGGIANVLATRIPGLAAAVSFYGSAPASTDVAQIKVPLLLHFAANDERINAAWPGYEAALKAADVAYEAHVYPNTQHGFNNNTTPRYDETAAKLAWARTLGFFAQHL